MLLLLLQLLSWWAVSATAVPVARMQHGMQRHRLLLRRPRQSTQQLAAAAGAKLRRQRGGEFGELLLLPRQRAARLLEKIGASLTEESAHFGFGPTQILFPWENQKDAHLKMKHDGALGLEFG